MGNANITQLQAHHDGASLFEIRFSLRCRDLLVRAGLEGTYLTRFIRVGGTAVVYGLALEQIEALRIALDQLRTDAVHYDKAALKALERELERVLLAERTKGLLPDPGLDFSYTTMALLQKDIPSPARYNIGDRAINDHVGEVTIVEPYGFYRASTRTGRFYDNDGDRLDYIWGYSVRTEDGRRYVARAGELLDADGRRTHLQLVQDCSVAVPTSGDIDD